MDSLIYLTDSLMEIGPCSADIDFDIGHPDRSTNDFLMRGVLPEDVGGIYVPGTEFGGLIDRLQSRNTSETVTNRGFTWRGLLTQGVIEPPADENYKVVSGDANAIIRDLLSSFLGGLFYVPEETSGITITNYQFVRFCTILDGLTDMLAENGAKLVVKADKLSAGAPVRVQVSAAPITTIGDKYSKEYPVDMTYTETRRGITHLICLGQGELKDRTRIDLYVGANGEITDTPYYTGINDRTATFDYSNAQSKSELRKYGIRRLNELKPGKAIGINDAEVDGDVGDKVYGDMNGMGTTVTIVQKVLTISGGIWTYESKIEGDT
jgi:hypothetical protein